MPHFQDSCLSDTFFIGKSSIHRLVSNRKVPNTMQMSKAELCDRHSFKPQGGAKVLGRYVKNDVDSSNDVQPGLYRSNLERAGMKSHFPRVPNRPQFETLNRFQNRTSTSSECLARKPLKVCPTDPGDLSTLQSSGNSYICIRPGKWLQSGLDRTSTTACL